MSKTRWMSGSPYAREFCDVTSDSGRRVRIPLDGPCVCGSSRSLRYCCDHGGTLLPPAATTTPRSPQTGYSHPKCYARALNDCERKISREHYFSKSLMKAFARSRSQSDTVRLIRQNLPDITLPSDQAAQSNMLCRRHNSCLSDLDATASLVFRAIHEGTKATPLYNCRAVRGKNLELWLLKVMCGFFAAGNLNVPVDWLQPLFGYHDLDEPRGLYMQVPEGKTVKSDWSIEFGTYRDERGTSGCEVSLCGVRFILDFRGERQTHRVSDVGSMKVYRPKGIWFTHSDTTTFYLWLEWGDVPAAYESVVLDVLPTG